MTQIEPSTLRILNAKGQTIGTGFLVAKTLAVTCAHVAMAAAPDGENRIRAQFTGQKQPISVRILDQFLDLERDVAILELESAPEGVQPLRLGLAAQCQPGNPFHSLPSTPKQHKHRTLTKFAGEMNIDSDILFGYLAL